MGTEQIKSSGSKIFIDGHDMTNSDRIHCFATISQENDLFRGLNLKDNILYGISESLVRSDPEATSRALINAAEDAQLDTVVSRIQGGWGGSVGPRGRLLSGGERQRVCLARALCREELGSPILLMDEATSSLDARTESLVTQAIMNRVGLGATAVIVAHRLTSVQQCNLIIVLQDGQIVEQGTHEELLKRCSESWYAEAWRLQSSSSSSIQPVDEP